MNDINVTYQYGKYTATVRNSYLCEASTLDELIKLVSNLLCQPVNFDLSTSIHT